MQLVDDSRINLFNSGKRLFYFFLFLIIIFLFNLLFFLFIDYQFEVKEKENLLRNINLIETVLNEKKNQLSNYAKILARFPDLTDLNENTLLTRRIYNLHSNLNVKGIQIWDKELNPIFETGSGFVLEKNCKLNDSILEVLRDGYSVSFYNQNEYLDLQITSFSPVYDEYSIRSSSYVSVTEVIKKSYISNIAYDIDGVINFYTINELKNSNMADYNENIPSYIKSKAVYKENIGDRTYFVSYLPVKDFYSNIIGYFTILKPQGSNNIIQKLLILNLIYSIFMLCFMRYLYPKLFK